MRKVKKGMKFLEYGPGHQVFALKSVYGANAKTDRGTKIRVSRLTSKKYYAVVG